MVKEIDANAGIEAEQLGQAVARSLQTSLSEAPVVELSARWTYGYQLAMELLSRTSVLKSVGYDTRRYSIPIPNIESSSLYGTEDFAQKIRRYLESEIGKNQGALQHLTDCCVRAQAYIIVAQKLYSMGWHLRCSSAGATPGLTCPWLLQSCY